MNINDYIKNPLNQKLSTIFYVNSDIMNIKVDNDEVSATVSAFGYVNQCQYKIKNDKLIHYQCDCHYCDELSPCGHIGAVMMKLSDNITLPYYDDKIARIKHFKENEEKRKREAYLKQKSKITTEFIQQQKQLYQQSLSTILQQTQYELEPVFNHMKISYRVGNEKKYVIKNITTFLNQIKEKKKVTYGVALSFIHDESAFDDFALQQIEFLKFVNNSLRDNSFSKYYYTTLSKTIEIDETIIDAFFDLYYDHDYSTFRLNKDNEHIQINVKEDYDYYILSLEKKNPIFMVKNIYIFMITKKH